MAVAGGPRQDRAAPAVPREIRSLDEGRALLRALPAADTAAAEAARAREAALTKPAGALGRLEELAAWLAAWQGRHPPRLERARACVFAGNHGVAARGVSAYPAAVTAQMVRNFESGGAAINQLCRSAGVELRVIALDLDRPTGDISSGPAMDEPACARAVSAGLAAVDSGLDVLCLGEMGIANTAAAAALCQALYGGRAADWVGPGTGLAESALAHKADVVARAVDRNAGGAADALDLLRRLGGRELAAVAGAVLAARLERVPVLLDGFACTAAAAVLHRLDPGALDHCRVAHLSPEPGHARLVARLGQAPLLDLGMRLGEGTGATLAVSLLRAAVVCHTGMATFGEAGVSRRPEDDA